MKRLAAVATCSIFLAAIGCGPESDDAPSGAEPAARAFAAPTMRAIASRQGITGPVAGEIDGKSYRGTFRVLGFEPRADGVYAIARIGNLIGDLTAADIRKIERQELAIPITAGPQLLAQQQPAPAQTLPDGAVDSGTDSCPVLLLQLQPLHIELLGLVVDLQRLELTVTAKEGEEALLGDLLCAVAGLLDPDGLLGGPTPENITKAADLLGEVLGALLSGVVGGLVDGLSGGNRDSENTSLDGGTPPPPPPAPTPPGAPAQPAPAQPAPAQPAQPAPAQPAPAQPAPPEPAPAQPAPAQPAPAPAQPAPAQPAPAQPAPAQPAPAQPAPAQPAPAQPAPAQPAPAQPAPAQPAPAQPAPAQPAPAQPAPAPAPPTMPALDGGVPVPAI